ncbi:MAG TPA: hypothetical protein VE999_17890 [Gemmataceae bacterium]|nr:hypothetical protein [Gemmataceae bacterium]
MARICGQCKKYDAAGTLESCPTCRTPMQFTLLPPPGRDAAPLTLTEPEPQARTRRSTAAGRVDWSFELIGWVFRYHKLAGLVVVPLLLICSFFGVQINTNGSLKTRYDRIQVGMDVDEVEHLLRPPVRYRGRFLMPQHHVLDAVPDEGPYTINYTESGSGSITLDFQDGVLVRKSEQGLK